jgi:hypothetical protein
MAIQLVLSQSGPLPITVNFNALADTPMYLEVNGSVWTQTANKMIGIAIALDGQAIGKAQIFSNANATHRTVVPAYLAIKLKQGQHTLTLSPSSSVTVSDVNDLFTAVIHY